jgi:hypothetical protein
MKHYPLTLALSPEGRARKISPSTLGLWEREG